jgi:hypothetical protein
VNAKKSQQVLLMSPYHPHIKIRKRRKTDENIAHGARTKTTC